MQSFERSVTRLLQLNLHGCRDLYRETENMNCFSMTRNANYVRRVVRHFVQCQTSIYAASSTLSTLSISYSVVRCAGINPASRIRFLHSSALVVFTKFAAA